MESEQKTPTSCTYTDMEVSEHLDCAIQDASELLHSANKELAANMRRLVSLRRKVDEVPIQAELIQYERRFSELNVQIQGKLRQTRDRYATYNALLNVKDLMLKEISLLNSINSQFENAITSTDGRTKLVDSMEAILKGTQQKLDKMQHSLQGEQKTCDDLREGYAAAMMDQRRSSTLVKAFQEECARNEMLRSQASLKE